MYVTGDTIIRFATVLGALGTLGALLYRSFHWMEQQKAQQAEIENIKKEQCVICYGPVSYTHLLRWSGRLPAYLPHCRDYLCGARSGSV